MFKKLNTLIKTLTRIIKMNGKYHVCVYEHVMKTPVEWTGLATNLKGVIVAGKHTINENENTICNGGPHFHLICELKIAPRTFRDWGIEKCRREGIDPIWLQISRDLSVGFIKYINNQNHLIKAVEYVKKYEEIDMQLDNILPKMKFMESLYKHNTDFLFHDRAKTEEFDVEFLTKFRKEYPRKSDWQRKAVQQNWSYKEIEQVKKIEANYCNWQLEKPLTEPLNDTEEAFAQEAFKYYNLIRQKQKESKTGAAIIFAGEAASGKSVMCEILSSQFKPVHKWIGTQFVEKDILKFDTLVEKQTRCLIVEEVIWTIPRQSITVKDSLYKIKEYLQPEFKPRTAKNKKAPKFDTCTLEVLMFSFNPSRECNYEILLHEIQSDDSLSRRIIPIYFDNLLEKVRVEKNLHEKQLINISNIKLRFRDLIRSKLTLDEYMVERQKLYSYKGVDIETQFNILQSRCEEPTGDTYEIFMEEYFEQQMAKLPIKENEEEEIDYDFGE